MKARSTILLLYIAWLIAAVTLVFAAAEKQPDSFYTLLRWVCCAVFVCLFCGHIFSNEAHVVAVDFWRAGGFV